MEKTAFNANYVPKTAPQILYISKNHLQTDCVSPYEKYSVLDYRIAINLKNKINDLQKRNEELFAQVNAIV